MRRLKDDQAERFAARLVEVNGPRREEAIGTLVAEGVDHETAAVLRSARRPPHVFAASRAGTLPA